MRYNSVNCKFFYQVHLHIPHVKYKIDLQFQKSERNAADGYRPPMDRKTSQGQSFDTVSHVVYPDLKLITD